MRPLPHKGASLVGVDTPIDTAIDDPAGFALHFLAQLPVNAAEAIAAFASTASHDVVHRQVVSAHAVAGLVQQQQAELLAAAGRVVPSGPLRAGAERAQRLQTALIDTWLESVNAYGRAFARKVHAFPVAPVLSD
jgi:hypothetical protein